MIEFQIAHVVKSGGHPVHKFLAQLLPEIERQGLTLQAHMPTAISWDHQAVYAYIDGKIIAAVQFSFNDWNRSVNTGYSYTLPDFRRKGVNAALIFRIEEIAGEQGYRRIIRETHVNNKSAIAAFEGAGYVASSVVHVKEILADFEFLDMNHLGKT